MRFMHFLNIKSFLALPLVALLASCSSLEQVKEDAAHRFAEPAWMKERQIAASPFLLTAFERVHEKDALANIYIEGDGKAWVSRRTISLDPTPSEPIALELASKDLSDNVIYLARPCQFSKMLDKEKRCDSFYWTGGRFAPEVIAAYDKALDDIKYRYGVRGFNLIGYSGGASVAALVAARRDDVYSLRSVAGNLDHVAHSQIHNVSLLDGSLNPPDFAARLKQIPQRHFIGGQDEIVPWGVFHSYTKKIGKSNCISYSFIQEAEHDDGWVNIWPELMAEDVSCRGVEREVVFRPIPREAPKYMPRQHVEPRDIDADSPYSTKP